MKAVIALVTLVMSMSTFAQTAVSISIKARGIDTYKSINATKFEGTTTNGNATVKLKIVQDGQVLADVTEHNPISDVNTSDIQILTTRSLIMTDTEKNTSHRLNAVIDAKTRRGNIKRVNSILIPEAQVRKYLAESLEDEAFAVLNQLNVSTEDADIDIQLTVSDSYCKSSGSELKCDTSAEISLSVIAYE
jgi:hypothetical protein